MLVYSCQSLIQISTPGHLSAEIDPVKSRGDDP